METKFAPAERDPLDKVLQSNISLSTVQYMKDILTAFSWVVFILNEKRQIVFNNDMLLQNLGIDKDYFVLGDRPGEAFNCVHSDEGPSGCGTSDSCRHCNLVNVIIKARQKKHREVTEAVVIVSDGDYNRQLDLEVTAMPFVHENHEYIIVSMVDITEKKRKQTIERIFFHDIINSASSLSGIFNILNELTPAEREECIQAAASLSVQIVEEIKAQRDMQMAEQGDLVVANSELTLSAFMEQVSLQVKRLDVAFGKMIRLKHPSGEPVRFMADQTLLTRVVINMLKNSLEATEIGQTVAFDGRQHGCSVRISVTNSSYIPEDLQQQIFQRSFSTKGKGRGLGTYSIKLLGERYLHGKVGFISSPEAGTTFWIDLPLGSFS